MNEKAKVDAELIELLICPNCRGEIDYREDEEVIACVGECGYTYPVVDGIPHMLVDEATKP
jgi:hypothetical protein